MGEGTLLGGGTLQLSGGALGFLSFFILSGLSSYDHDLGSNDSRAPFLFSFTTGLSRFPHPENEVRCFENFDTCSAPAFMNETKENSVDADK